MYLFIYFITYSHTKKSFFAQLPLSATCSDEAEHFIFLPLDGRK